MAKARSSIPESVAAAVKFASDRTCCICRERGRAVQIHHIDEDPTHHDPANLAVLCLLCHNDTQMRGGFGRALRAPDVIIARDDWLETVARRRKMADEAAVQAGLGLQDGPRAVVQPDDPALSISSGPVTEAAQDKLLEGLPAMLTAARALAQDAWDTGGTSQMTEATWDVVSVVVDIWVRLARRYPAGHFDGQDPRDFFDAHLRQRGEWHQLIAEPDGAGTGGTIIRVIAAAAMLDEAQRMVEETVATLWSYEDVEGLNHWRKAWRKA